MEVCVLDSSQQYGSWSDSTLFAYVPISIPVSINRVGKYGRFLEIEIKQVCLNRKGVFRSAVEIEIFSMNFTL